MSPSNDTLLSRKEAADRLNISVRTLDRHIRRGFFDVKRIDRSVWISKPSFERYYQEQSKGKTVIGMMSRQDDNGVSTPVESVESITVSESDPSEEGATFQSGQERIKLSSHEHDYRMTPSHIYKTLYEEIKEKHDEQTKRLEGAHYRVGQLEAQVKTMVPMLEFKKERQRLLLMDKQYKEDMKEAKVRVVQTKRLYESERLNKNVYIALVYGLLAVQLVFWMIAQ